MGNTTKRRVWRAPHFYRVLLRGLFEGRRSQALIDFIESGRLADEMGGKISIACLTKTGKERSSVRVCEARNAKGRPFDTQCSGLEVEAPSGNVETESPSGLRGRKDRARGLEIRRQQVN